MYLQYVFEYLTKKIFPYDYGFLKNNNTLLKNIYKYF